MSIGRSTKAVGESSCALTSRSGCRCATSTPAPMHLQPYFLLTFHLLSTYSPLTLHLLSTYFLPTFYLLSTNSPLTSYLLSTYFPLTLHLLSTYFLPTLHLLSTYSPLTMYRTRPTPRACVPRRADLLLTLALALIPTAPLNPTLNPNPAHPNLTLPTLTLTRRTRRPFSTACVSAGARSARQD